MSKKTETGTARDARLKRALKANLARRKAQAKARTRGATDDEAEKPGKSKESGDG